jgi:hypothetical protein
LDNSSNETSFLIERRIGTGTYAQIASVGAGVTGYTDTTVAASTQYTYRVRASNSGGTSAYSNTSTVTTLSAPAPRDPVAITEVNYKYDQYPPTLVYRFNTDVSASINNPDVTVTNLATGASFNPTGWSWSSALNEVTFKFANGIPNGNYRATFRAGGVWDTAGIQLANAHTYNFFALTGDINRDRSVDILDLNILTSHWRATSAVFGDGDLNGDHLVNSVDLGILSANWQQRV